MQQGAVGFLYSDRYHSGAHGSEPMNSVCLRAPLRLYVSACVPSMCCDVCKGLAELAGMWSQWPPLSCEVGAAGEMSRAVSVKARWTDHTLSSAKPCESVLGLNVDYGQSPARAMG